MIRVCTDNDRVFAVVSKDHSSMTIVRELPVPANGPVSPELEQLMSEMIKHQLQVIGGCVIESWSNPDA